MFGDCSTENELEEITALLQGNISVPLPTYFTIGDRPLPTRIVEKIEADDEVCPNLHFLGKRGTLRTSDGLRISALGGTFEGAETPQPASNAGGRFQSTYSEADARALFGVHSADIFITTQWPKGIRTGSRVPVPEDQSLLQTENQSIADVCATLKPRYHFSASQFFYEREPFFHMPTEDDPDVKPLTRFISMASYGSKEKAMYAFTLEPKAAPPLAVPVGATASPLPAPQTKRKGLPSQKESFSRFAATDEDTYQRGPRKRQRDRAPPPGPDQCFFCLSNPNIATHLITSIANETYLTTAKGPLTPKNFFPALGFPGHMLIIPFAHSPTLSSIADPGTRTNTYTEMQRYRTALHQMLTKKAPGALGAVTWEVSRGSGIHDHWQFLPVPIHLLREDLVEAAFKVEGENLSYPRFTTLPQNSTTDPSTEPGDFFRVWIWTPTDNGTTPEQPSSTSTSEDKTAPVAGKEKVLLLELTPDFRFDLNFGRRVMAKLLELDRRMDWRVVKQSQEEEEADAEAFKEAFAPFDFSV